MAIEHFSSERVHPDMIKPINLLKIWRGKTDMYPFTPVGTLEIWNQHKFRYLFAKKYRLGKTLDIACGNGYGKRLLNLDNESYVGVDINLDAIKEARRLNKNDCLFVAANAIRIPFPDHQFDSVISFETIEHIPFDQIDLYLAEIKRVLKKGGQFFVSTPNKNIYSQSNGVPTNKNHFFEFQPDDFFKLLQKHFNNVQLFQQNPLTNKENSNRASNLSRLKRLQNLLIGNSYKLQSFDSNSNKQPSFMVARCIS